MEQSLQVFERWLTAALTPQTFAMAMCVYLIVRFEGTLASLKKSMERMTRAIMFLAHSDGNDEVMENFIANGNGDSVPEKEVVTSGKL